MDSKLGESARATAAVNEAFRWLAFFFLVNFLWLAFARAARDQRDCQRSIGLYRGLVGTPGGGSALAGRLGCWLPWVWLHVMVCGAWPHDPAAPLKRGVCDQPKRVFGTVLRRRFVV